MAVEYFEYGEDIVSKANKFISISAVNNWKPLRKADTLELFDEFHQEIFTCFFQIDEQ